MKHQAEVLYESAGLAEDGKPFLTVKRAQGYYEYAERAGQDSVAFILRDYIADTYGLIREPKPPMDERFDTKMHLTTAFGGSLDNPRATAQEVAVKECYEEAGYIVEPKDVSYIGATMVSTQSSQMCHLYLLDVTSKEPIGETEGDPTVWLHRQEVLNNNDWKSIMILAKEPRCN